MAAQGSGGVLLIAGLAWRMLRGTDPRCLWKFIYCLGFKGYRAVERFKKDTSHGRAPVPFLMISLTDRCNLNCAGCWVSSNDAGRDLSMEDVDQLITHWKQKGVFFFGLLGGEPLLYPALFEIFERHSDCYFQLFTNGTLLDTAAATRLKHCANVSPLISVEGLETESDRRRGGTNVYRRAMDALACCREAGLVTGVACSVCATNYDEVVTDEFAQQAIGCGAAYLWYYIYRPVGSNPSPELALSREQIIGLRRFLVDIRCRVPLMVVDAYWDHEGNALCPAAVGISHHIGPGGDVELCPPLQMSAGKITDGANAIIDSEKLKSAREFLCGRSQGCILLEDPAAMEAYARQNGLTDSSGRGTFLQELLSMEPRAGHDMGDEKIPEKHWAYRFAKKHWFFGFGAYG